MRWAAFRAACPEIAERAEARFRADELVILGTIRPDGSPRVSPCELDFVGDDLLLGMMWESRKVRDLQRDARVAVHSAPAGRLNPGGDVKLYGVAVDERDPELRTAYRDEIRRRIGWAPDEPNFHLFSLDVHEAAFITFGDDALVLAWDPERGLRHPRHPG
jgi:hypothetical protein